MVRGRGVTTLRRTRHLGQNPAVRAAEAKLAVRLSVDLVALVVDAQGRDR